MEGITIQWDKTVLYASGNMRMDSFRPIKRSVSDLHITNRRREKSTVEARQATVEARQARGGSHVPVVSVQYDVPNTKSTPGPPAFRYKRMHTPLAYQTSFSRSKSEDKINQLTSAVDNHRLKGLGVGKCYEYYPPPTAPEHGRIPVPVTPATTPGNSRLGSYQSFSPSQFFPCQDIASLRTPQERFNKDLPNESPTLTMGNSRQWQNVKGQGQGEEKLFSRKNSKRYGYLQSPLKFSQSVQENIQEDNSEETRSVHRGQGHTSQGSIRGDDVYGYNNLHVNITRKETENMKEAFSSPDTMDTQTFEDSNFTLRSLLLHRTSSESDKTNRPVLKLPKLNVVEITKDKNGTNAVENCNAAAALNMNQRLNQMRAQKELTSVHMYSQRMVRLKMTQNHRRSVLPWFGNTMVVPQGLGSSSTPTVPYSTADILYGNEVNGRTVGDDVRQNSFVEGERSKLKAKELDYPGNIRRPNSKSGTRKSLTIDAVALDKDREDQLKGLSSSLLPTTKPASHFRPNGIRSNILKGEQLYTAKQNGATNGKDPDDLVAMGTLWSPNNGQQTPQQQQQPPPPTSVESQRQPASRSNSLSNNTNTNSYPSKVTSSSSNVHNSMSSSNNTVSSQRKYPSNSIRPIVNVQNNVSGKKNNNLQKEEADPKYTDPMIGAPASFQQRIIELGALEGDTVRWERSKRLKKKKQDRDS